MRTRKFHFFDTKALEVRFSFQVYINNGWECVCDGPTPLLFNTKAERDDKQAEMRRKPYPALAPKPQEVEL